MIELKKNLTPFFNDGFSGIIHDAFQQCVSARGVKHFGQRFDNVYEVQTTGQLTLALNTGGRV